MLRKDVFIYYWHLGLQHGETCTGVGGLYSGDFNSDLLRLAAT